MSNPIAQITLSFLANPDHPEMDDHPVTLEADGMIHLTYGEVLEAMASATASLIHEMFEQSPRFAPSVDLVVEKFTEDLRTVLQAKEEE